ANARYGSQSPTPPPTPTSKKALVDSRLDLFSHRPGAFAPRLVRPDRTLHHTETRYRLRPRHHWRQHDAPPAAVFGSEACSLAEIPGSDGRLVPVPHDSRSAGA